jgi:hypothetical protein
MSFFKDNEISNYWFIVIFGIKIIVSILLTFIYTDYYSNRDTADIYKYFDDSSVIFNALCTNPIDYFKILLGFDFDYHYFHVNYYSFMNHWSRPYSADLISDSHIIIRFNAFVRLFSFGYFQVHNIFINFVSLVGLTAIYKAFKPYLKNKEKLLFYVIYLVPSVLFWGSGLLKESIIFFGLGLLFLNLFNLSKQIKFKYLLYISIAIILLIYTKFYILIALSVPILGYLLNHYLKIKNSIFGYIISGLLFIVVSNVFPLINDRLDIVFQIVNKQQTFSNFIAEVPTNSGFIIAELDNGFSIIKNIPAAIINTTIRPYFWECNSFFVLLSALENMLVICCLILTIYFRLKINSFNKNLIYFNLIFVFSLFTLIGLTTPVFGAIIRYKIPGLLLLFISLLILIDIKKIKAIHPLFNKVL